jgi:nitroreductase
MENEVIKTLTERRSVRRYTKKQVEEEKLELILKAGTYAPSGMGSQSPIMVVVQDPETISLLSRLNAVAMGSSGDPFYGAPTVVIVLADKNMWTCVEDGSLVMGNLMNAAHAVGDDSCWIHRAKETFESKEGKDLLKKWGISGDYVGIGNCILGYRSGPYPTARQRKSNFIYRV